MVAKPEFTESQLHALLDAAKKESFFDYVALLTMVALNLRRGSLVGQNDGRSSPNPGLRIENLTADGIRVFEKHGPKGGIIKPVPPALRSMWEQIIEKREIGRIFPRTTGWVWYRIKKYSEVAGLLKIHIKPNTLSDFSEYYDAFLLKILKLERPKKPDVGDEEQKRLKDVQVFHGQPINLPGLTYAPTNEQGVVHLFGLTCVKLGFLVESMRQAFPDAEVMDYRQDKNPVDYRNSKSPGVRKRIEFEFKSSRFSRQKGHTVEKCDIIVCWEHDWKGCPNEIEVIELRSRIGELRQLLSE